MFTEDRLSRQRREYADRMLRDNVKTDPTRQIMNLTFHDLHVGDVFTISGYGLLIAIENPSFNVTATHTQTHLVAYHFDGAHRDPVKLTITTSTDCPVKVVRTKPVEIGGWLRYDEHGLPL